VEEEKENHSQFFAMVDAVLEYESFGILGGKKK
jgi:hypothetical protein